MKNATWFIVCALTTLTTLSLFGTANAQYADAVVSYNQGTTPAIDFGSGLPYNLPTAALGIPELLTGEAGGFPSVVSPFSPPFERAEVLTIGEGGHATLRLSHFAVPQAGGPEIGVFVNVGINDASWPNGVAENPARTFSEAFSMVPEDSAIVEVSEDGSTWEILGTGAIRFNNPTNAYTDLQSPYASTPGSVLADFRQPFTGGLSDFDGLPYFDAGGNDMLSVLAGSGGGTWLDISSTSFSQVGYVRFSVLDDGDAQTSLNFELDALAIASGALGATVPEPTSILLVCMAVVGLMFRQKR